MALTKLENMINPEVMADMLDGKIENAIAVAPFAVIDRSLAGKPGDTITVPVFKYIGDATDVAEGEEVTPAQLTTDDSDYTIKKVMKAVTLTDEAVLSGLGNPVGQATTQLGKSIASKIDTDCIEALGNSSVVYKSKGIISYDEVVDAIGMFGEELNTDKVMFVHPDQVTQLRHDSNFISADKYDNKVIMTGEIGMICNTRIVPTRRVKLGKHTAKDDCYINPIVKIETDTRTEDELPAVTIYLKRDTNLETERHTLSRTTDISADKHYVAALTNETKVVVAMILKTAI